MHDIKEAIHIKQNLNNMNRLQGERHLLPNMWDPLLSPGPDDIGQPPLTNDVAEGIVQAHQAPPGVAATAKDKKGRGGHM